jgi:hypothetical protein
VDVEGYSHLFCPDVERSRSYLADTIVFQISVEHFKQNQIIMFCLWEFNCITSRIFKINIPKPSGVYKLCMPAEV